MTALYRTLAFRYLLARKRRMAVTIIAIALGVTLVTAVNMTGRSIIEHYEELIGGITGQADFQVRANAGAGFPADLLDEVAQTPGVEVAAPIILSGSSIADQGRRTIVTVYGIDPSRDGLIRAYRLESGRLPDEAGEIAITHELAGQLGIQVGRQVQLLGPTGFNSHVVVGIFDTRGAVRGSFGPFAVMTLAAAQDVFSRPGVLDAIDVIVAPGFYIDDVKAAVSEAVAGRAVVSDPGAMTGSVERALNSIFSMLVLAGWISLFAAAFIIYTNVSMSIVERRKQLAILRSLGLRRREVFSLVGLEVITVGLLASGLGLLMGYGLATGLTAQVVEQFASLIGAETVAARLGGQDVAMALGLGLGVALVAALMPTWATVRIDPVEAMRPEVAYANGQGGVDALRPVIGLMLLAMPALFMWLTWPRIGEVSSQTFQVWGASAVVMLLGAALLVQSVLSRLAGILFRPLLRLLFGVTGRLAADNLARQPRRAAASSLALMVALAYMIGMGGFAAAMFDFNDQFMDRTLGWDVWVSTSIVSPDPALMELPASFGDELGQLPGVTLMAPQKFAVAFLDDGFPIYLRVFDFELLPQYSEMLLAEGDHAEVVSAMQQGGNAIIQTTLAQELGLGFGDRVSIPSPAGIREFTVVGVTQDPSPGRGGVYLDRQDYLRYWNDDSVTAFVLKTEPGRQEEVKQAVLEGWGASMGLVVMTKDQFWADMQEAGNALTGTITGLAWLAIAVAGLALANTLFSNVMERMREFGALRAVGARRRDVTRVVAGEAMATGLLGGVLGIAAGLGLYLLFIESSELLTGFPADFAVPWEQIAMGLVAALVLAPLIGLLPARWAARMEVVEALRYE